MHLFALKNTEKQVFPRKSTFECVIKSLIRDVLKQIVKLGCFAGGESEFYIIDATKPD